MLRTRCSIVKTSARDSECQRAESVDFNEGDAGQTVQEDPWKAPGKDEVQGFWIKKLDTMHERISRQLNGILNDGNALPVQMIYGRTVLCLKDPSKGKAG